MEAMLKGKRILVVDDEPDILENLEETLDMCLVDKAPNFDTARKFLQKQDYDAAILDIMGVRGYDLLEMTHRKGIPTLMLTAHALTPDNLVKSIAQGAQAYVPKEEISHITNYLADVLKAGREGKDKERIWFKRLKPFFDKKFGSNWREKHREFWNDFDKARPVSKKEVEEIL